MPVKVLSEEYIDKLWEFCTKCKNQLRLDNLKQTEPERTENIQEEIEEYNE